MRHTSGITRWWSGPATLGRVVMTLAVIHAGDGIRYLTKEVARHDGPTPDKSLGEYYSESGEAPGQWYGRGAAALGVAGEATEEQLLRLFGTGVHPDTGEELGRKFRTYRTVAERTELALAAEPDATEARRSEIVGAVERAGERQAVGGFDHTFSPVKSVSALWAVADNTTRKTIEDSLTGAWADTLGWAEDHGIFRTRVGTNGVEYRAVAGVTAAAFTHRSSRTGDPQLHVHVAISNKVQDRHGNWLSLDSAGLHRGVVSMSEHFDTMVERRLNERLGWEFAPRADRPEIREVVGSDPELVRHWSSRRRQVEARYEELLGGYRAAHGQDPDVAVQRRLAQQATLDTRPAKPDGRVWSDERELWRSDALTVTDRPWDELVAMAAAARPEAHEALSADDAAERALATVLERRAVWRPHHLRAEAERLARRERFDSDGAHRAWVDQVVDEGLARSVIVSAPALASSPDGMRWRGDSFRPDDDLCYTSPEVLSAEVALVAAQDARQAPTVSPEIRAARVVGAERPLSPDQLAAVHRLVGEDRWLDVLQGPAGSGKTSTLATVAGAWSDAGGRVLALAPSQAATDALGAGIGAEVTVNLSKWDYEHRVGGPLGRLHAGDLVVVDEASMAGTLPLGRLVTAAATAGAKVILVGDERQLGAVPAGGAFRLLVGNGGCAALDELHRFRSEWDPDADPELVAAWPDRGAWEAQATLRLRTGDESVIDEYLAAGVVVGGARDDLRGQVYERWEADVAGGLTSLMISDRNTEVAKLSERARAARVQAGQVEPGGVALHNDSTAGVGDWVVTRDNDRRISYNGGRAFVTNGAVWTVTARGDDGSLTLSNRAHAGVVSVPAAYVARSVELAYASTVHRAQGMTADTSRTVAGTETARELAYVAASRGRQLNELYLDTGGTVDIEGERPATPHADPAAIMAQMLAHESAERSVTETVAAEQAAQVDPARIVARYNHVVDRWSRDPADILTAAGAEGLAASATMRNQIARAERDGVDTAAWLATQAGKPGAAYPATMAMRLGGHVRDAGRGGWLAAPPPAAPEPIKAWLADTERYLQTVGAGRAAADAAAGKPWLDSPELANANPDDIAGIAAYRAAYAIDDQRSALGAPGGWGPQAAGARNLAGHLRRPAPADEHAADRPQDRSDAPQPVVPAVQRGPASKRPGMRTDPLHGRPQRPRPRGPGRGPGFSR